MAKCQDVNIIKQYDKYNVKCFDLRIRFDKNYNLIVAHNLAEYKITLKELEYYFRLFNYWEDCYVRVLLETRNKKQYYSNNNIELFKKHCEEWENKYPNIKFWCGRNLYNWKIDYKFKYSPSCEEKYSSVCKPKLIDDWYPRIFAKKNNKKIKKEGTTKDILLIDFINYE